MWFELKCIPFEEYTNGIMMMMMMMKLKAFFVIL